MAHLVGALAAALMFGALVYSAGASGCIKEMPVGPDWQVTRCQAVTWSLRRD